MDLVLRATVVFFFVFLLTRLVGKRELAGLEPFDLILLVVIGDLVQQGVTQSDYSVTGAIVVISTIALLTVGLSLVNLRGHLHWRHPRIGCTVEPRPGEDRSCLAGLDFSSSSASRSNACSSLL